MPESISQIRRNHYDAFGKWNIDPLMRSLADDVRWCVSGAARGRANIRESAAWSDFKNGIQKEDLPMKHQDYSYTVTAKVTPEQAFERISRVADWWTKGFTGAAQKVGDAFTVRFGETFVDFAVVDLVPARRIVWRVSLPLLSHLNAGGINHEDDLGRVHAGNARDH